MAEDTLSARTQNWYNEYAAAVGREKCVFCDLREKYLVTEEDGVVLTANLFPYTEGHLMVVPRRHVEHLQEVSDVELLASRRLALRGMDLLTAELGLDSFWLLLREGPTAGKTVKHLHWQVMPYHEGMVTWHYDFKPAKIKPIDLAERLRKRL